MTNKIRETIQSIKPIDQSKSHEIQNALDNLTKPPGSLGNLEDLAKRYCLITGKSKPVIRNKVIITMAADHGVAREGVSAYPPEVTRQMVINFLRGGAGSNVLARHAGAKVIVVDMGVACDFGPLPGLVQKKIAYGTQNMLLGPAMSREDACLSIERGIEVVEENWAQGIDLLGIGEMENDPRFSDLERRMEHNRELIAILDRTFAQHPRAEWLERMGKYEDLRYGYVNAIPDLVNDPQIIANKYIVDFDHPVWGKMKEVGFPVTFSKTPASLRTAAPEQGRHNAEVYSELLGLTAADLKGLEERGVI